MHYYKVNVTALTAPGNRILRKEDNKVYTEDTWGAKKAAALVESGHLIKVPAPGAAAAKPPAPQEASGKPAESGAPAGGSVIEQLKAQVQGEEGIEEGEPAEAKAGEGGSPEGKAPIPAYDDVTKKEIRALLEERKVEIDGNANKTDLYAALEAAW